MSDESDAGFIVWRRQLCAVLRARVPKVCPWCYAYDGPCFHCGRCADCGALDRHDDEHAVGCFFG